MFMETRLRPGFLFLSRTFRPRPGFSDSAHAHPPNPETPAPAPSPRGSHAIIHDQPRPIRLCPAKSSSPTRCPTPTGNSTSVIWSATCRPTSGCARSG
ncbi:hypothetical protein [Lysobacter gummosus]|uniref:hypothetical protein n=1 Tax=Lysobacter gummosus TaxID=262324 RepID=UPI003640AE8F